MGRALRIVDPQSIYHLLTRGCNRGRIFWDLQDGETYLRELSGAATWYRWEVFAWCLMPNHHHVVLRAPELGLSEGFKALNGNYSRRTNYRYGRCDHLLRNRFAWKRITGDAHFLNVVLYVVRNPIEAGLCVRAELWPFSSYRATAGLEPAQPWLAVDRVLRLFGRTREEARLEFADTVHSGRLSVSDTEVRETPVPPHDVG